MVANATHEDLRNMSETGGALETLGTTNIPATSGRDAIHIAVIRMVATTRLFPGQHVGVDGSPNAEKTVGIVDPYLPGPVYPDQPFWALLYPRTITGLRHVWTHPDFDDEVSPPRPVEVEVPTKDDVLSKAAELFLESADTNQLFDALHIDDRASDALHDAIRKGLEDDLLEDDDFVDRVIEKYGLTRSPAAKPAVTVEQSDSEKWLREFCDSSDCPDYDTLIGLLEKAYDTGYVNFGSDSSGEYDDYYSMRWGAGSWDSDYLAFSGWDAHGGIPPEFWDHVSVILGKPLTKEQRPSYFSCSC